MIRSERGLVATQFLFFYLQVSAICIRRRKDCCFADRDNICIHDWDRVRFGHCNNVQLPVVGAGFEIFLNQWQ